MKREDLRPYLNKEVETWSSKSHSALREELRKGYVKAEPGMPYHVEVQVLEDREDYVHVFVAVCSEQAAWSCYHPLSTSFLVYRDGRVDR